MSVLFLDDAFEYPDVCSILWIIATFIINHEWPGHAAQRRLGLLYIRSCMHGCRPESYYN